METAGDLRNQVEDRFECLLHHVLQPNGKLAEVCGSRNTCGGTRWWLATASEHIGNHGASRGSSPLKSAGFKVSHAM